MASAAVGGGLVRNRGAHCLPRRLIRVRRGLVGSHTLHARAHHGAISPRRGLVGSHAGHGGDSAPGRVLTDLAIVTAASALPASEEALIALPGWGGRGARRSLPTWWAAITSAMALPESELPGPVRTAAGPPPARAWPERDPVAATRLATCREALAHIAAGVNVPVENLISPESVRRLCWEPPADLGDDVVGAFLHDSGARAWQLELVVGPLVNALHEAAATSAASAAATGEQLTLD